MAKYNKQQTTDLNKKVNLLYRQLGKVVYNCNKENSQQVELETKRLKKKLSKTINKIKVIEKTMNKDSAKEQPVILSFEVKKNEDGIPLYRFCPHCKVGNHPDATHCIKCGKPLY